MVEKKTLFVVATPIGNLGDITERACQVLDRVDAIAAEDTRVTRKLLTAKGIQTPLISYYEGAKETRSRENILALLESGQAVALVSDAGSPGISDPGYRIIFDAVAKGFSVVVVPGASALVAALSLSTLPTDRFAFFGFLPRKGKDRENVLDKLAEFCGTTVLYESPRRLAATLKDLALRFPKAKAAVCREITKLHEQVVRGTLEQLAESYANREVKGEVVLVLDTTRETGPDLGQVLRRAKQVQDKLGLSVKDAAQAASLLTGVSKNEIYRQLLSEKED